MAKTLGKGLEALIKMHDTEENNRYLAGQILINKITPNKTNTTLIRHTIFDILLLLKKL